MEFREVKFYNRGATIVVPAPLGTIDSILGMAYNADLNDKDSSGVRHRMYPYITASVPEKLYRSSMTLIESRTELNANATILFASGGATRTQGKRYAVIQVESIDSVLSLQPQGAPLYAGQMFASKIYYGWRLYYVFEGDSSQLNEHIAANLATLIGASGDISNEVKRLHIQTHIVARGLRPKKSNAVIVANDLTDIQRYFTTEGSGDQPIAIEYECASSFSVPAYNIQAPKYSPGNFLLDSLRFSIAETDMNGSSWDGDGSAPDPIIQLYLNDERIYEVQFDDRLVATIPIGERFMLRSNDRLNVVLSDEDDLSGNDFIGNFVLIGNTMFSSYYLYDTVPMNRASGTQLKNVSLYVSPVR